MPVATKVEAVVRRIPMRTVQRMGTGRLEGFIENVFVRIIGTNGESGYGEAAPWSIFCEETPIGIKHTIEQQLAPIINGRNLWDWRRIRSDIDDLVLGCAYSKAAVEMAIFDLLAKECGVPLYRFIGGGIRKSVQLSYSLSAQSLDDELTIVSRLSESGYRIFKLKVGVLNPNEDALRMRQIRSAFPDVELRLDFNENGSVVSLHQLLPTIEECGITVLEQPFPAGSFSAEKWLSQRFSGILLADESCRSLTDLVSIVRTGHFQAISLKIQKLGGISKTLEAATIAHAHGLLSYCGGTSDTALAASVAVSVGVSIGNVLEGCDLYFPFEVIENPPELRLPDRRFGELFPSSDIGIGTNLPSDWFDG